MHFTPLAFFVAYTFTFNNLYSPENGSIFDPNTLPYTRETFIKYILETTRAQRPVTACKTSGALLALTTGALLGRLIGDKNTRRFINIRHEIRDEPVLMINTSLVNEVEHELESEMDIGSMYRFDLIRERESEAELGLEMAFDFESESAFSISKQLADMQAILQVQVQEIYDDNHWDTEPILAKLDAISMAVKNLKVDNLALQAAIQDEGIPVQEFQSRFSSI